MKVRRGGCPPTTHEELVDVTRTNALARLVEADKDGTEVRLAWIRTGEVFLQLDTDAVLEYEGDDLLGWVVDRYPDLVLEELADCLDGLLND
jgi:hypothetical protein